MRSDRVERANEGLMRCGRAVIGRHIVVAEGDARSYRLPSAKGSSRTPAQRTDLLD